MDALTAFGLFAARAAPIPMVDGLARRHAEDINRRIAQLVALRRELQRALDTCGHGRVGECPVIEALAEQSAV